MIAPFRRVGDFGWLTLNKAVSEYRGHGGNRQGRLDLISWARQAAVESGINLNFDRAVRGAKKARFCCAIALSEGVHDGFEDDLKSNIHFVKTNLQNLT